MQSLILQQWNENIHIILSIVNFQQAAIQNVCHWCSNVRLARGHLNRLFPGKSMAALGKLREGGCKHSRCDLDQANYIRSGVCPPHPQPYPTGHLSGEFCHSQLELSLLIWASFLDAGHFPLDSSSPGSCGPIDISAAQWRRWRGDNN